MRKEITLNDQAAKDIAVVAAMAGTNSKNYIENLVHQHLIDLGYPKDKSQKVVRVHAMGETLILKSKAKKK